MIEFIAGNLLDAREQYIAQGVAEGNQEGLGTGLALKISRRWPDVQVAFKKHVRSRKFSGGDIWVFEPSPARPGFVYLATQPDMYHATLVYLRRSVRALTKWAAKHQIESVALPKIGAGLGKLSWSDDVRPLLIDYLSEGSTRFVIYEIFRDEFEHE